MSSTKVEMKCSAKRKSNGGGRKSAIELNKPGKRNTGELDNTNSDSDIQVVDTYDLKSRSATKTNSKRKMPAKKIDFTLSDSNTDSDFVPKKPLKKKITGGKNLSQSKRSTQLQKEEGQKVVSDKQGTSQIEAARNKKVETIQSATTKISSEKAENKDDLYSGSGPSCGSVDMKSYVFLDGSVEEMMFLAKIMIDRTESLQSWYSKNQTRSSDALPLFIDKLERTIKLSLNSLKDLSSSIKKHFNINLLTPKQETESPYDEEEDVLKNVQNNSQKEQSVKIEDIS